MSLLTEQTKSVAQIMVCTRIHRVNFSNLGSMSAFDEASRHVKTAQTGAGVAAVLAFLAGLAAAAALRLGAAFLTAFFLPPLPFTAALNASSSHTCRQERDG